MAGDRAFLTCPLHPRPLPGVMGNDFLSQTFHLPGSILGIERRRYKPHPRNGGRSHLAVPTHSDWTTTWLREHNYFFYRMISKLGGCPPGASVPINATGRDVPGKEETRVMTSLGLLDPIIPEGDTQNFPERGARKFPVWLKPVGLCFFPLQLWKRWIK